ncbi:peptidase S8 [bacterium]|nr:peptidase S8 [bacterium]NBX82736.1 peptidase S8 [bacterium]
MLTSIFRTFILGATLIASLSSWGGESSKISPWLVTHYGKLRADQTIPTVFIFMADKADLSKIDLKLSRDQRGKAVFKALTETAERSQASLLAWLQQQNIPARSFYINNSIVAENISWTQLEMVSQRADVRKVSANPVIRAALPQSQQRDENNPKGPGANIVRFGATQVWDQFKVFGEGIVVGGQDTGVRWDHAALKAHYRGWDGKQANHQYSWHDAVKKNIGGSSSCGYNISAPCDDHSHGTHTIGTIVGDDFKGNQIGVAPKARWVACRNMDSGIGSPEMYTECFQWFLAPWPQTGDPIRDARPDLAPHVINNSWGCTPSEGCEGGEFEQVLIALRTAGIFVVASAGNDGSACSTIKTGPAFHSDLLLSVGANDHRDDSIASFSSRGPSTLDKKVGPHVTAPGVNIRSCVKGGGYAEFGWSGTSMAGPHVVGLVALLWSADPSLIGKIELTESLIKDKAEPKTSQQSCGGVPGSASPNNTFGYGLANAYEVVKSRLRPNP